MNKTRVKVEFEISGDKFDPDEITKMLCITPTETRIKGEPSRIKRIMNKHTTWGYYTGYQESRDINTQLKEIYDVFKSKTQILKKICEQYEVAFNICVVPEIYESKKPAMYIQHWFIEFLHEIHAEIDFDLLIYD